MEVIMNKKIQQIFLVIISTILLCFSLLPINTFAEEKSLIQENISVNTTQLQIKIASIDEETSKLIIGEEITSLSLNGYLDNLIKYSNDSNASYTLEEVEDNDLINLSNYDSTFKPNYVVTLSYSNDVGELEYKKYYLSTSTSKTSTEPIISPLAIDTIFDIASFSLSLSEYNKNKTFWNGFWVVADGAAVVFPGVPAVSGVKRMIEGSTSVLKPSLAKGVRKYSALQNISAPSNYKGSGWERHHIFEKRFASKLGTTSGKMLAIFIPKYNYHYQITQRMSKKIPWYEAPFKTKTQIIQAHIDAYGELWAESGFADEYWEFLYKFSKYKQYD